MQIYWGMMHNWFRFIYCNLKLYIFRFTIIYIVSIEGLIVWICLQLWQSMPCSFFWATNSCTYSYIVLRLILLAYRWGMFTYQPLIVLMLLVVYKYLVTTWKHLIYFCSLNNCVDLSIALELEILTCQFIRSQTRFSVDYG